MENISYKINSEVSQLLEKNVKYNRTTFISIKAEYTSENIAQFNLSSNNYCLWSKNNCTMFRTNILNNYNKLLNELKGYKILEITDGLTC